jgi:hypothetical protein
LKSYKDKIYDNGEMKIKFSLFFKLPKSQDSNLAIFN